MNETAWLVERRPTSGGSPMWWTGRGPASSFQWGEANQAIRFARQHDAEVAIAHQVPPAHRAQCVATEHLWGLQ